MVRIGCIQISDIGNGSVRSDNIQSLIYRTGIAAHYDSTVNLAARNGGNLFHNIPVFKQPAWFLSIWLSTERFPLWILSYRF